jgi:hypothetical protein
MSDSSTADRSSDVTKPDKAGTRDADQFFRVRDERMAELQARGLPDAHAWSLATLEYRISQWPSDWGDDLVILIYGDFRPPDSALSFSDLGITIEAGAVEGHLIKSALCTVKARVTMKERTVSGLSDAAQRINTLLGITAAIGLGNSGNGWCSQVIHGSLAGMYSDFQVEKVERAVAHLNQFSPEVNRKIRAALYWIREPRQMMMEGYKSDVLRVYAGYWNAFECLVEAVCSLRPAEKVSKSEKQARLDQFLADRRYRLNPSDLAQSDELTIDPGFSRSASYLTADVISECYRTFIDPGFVAKASHAIRVCFQDRADVYITECFKCQPKEDRLYNIRNAINHGDINTDDLEELIRVEAKHSRLWKIVFDMLHLFIPIDGSVDGFPS